MTASHTCTYGPLSTESFELPGSTCQCNAGWCQTLAPRARPVTMFGWPPTIVSVDHGRHGKKRDGSAGKQLASVKRRPVDWRLVVRCGDCEYRPLTPGEQYCECCGR